MSPVTDFVGRFRRPEYTGENRCVPCTVTNTLIALALSAVVWWAAIYAAGADPLAGGAAAAGVLAVSTALIALRGYLVPGTPTLTKRYFPPWLLAAFGKREPAAPAADEDVDVEGRLLAAGAVTECEDVDDLCLDDAFAEEWRAAIDAARDADADREALADLLDIDASDEFGFEEHGAAFTAHRGAARVGQWESRAAFLADVAAADLLADRVADWDRLPVAARSQVLGGLRLFLERCPDCGAALSLGEETVESCCSTVDVVAVTCTECEARVFEAKYDPAAAA